MGHKVEMCLLRKKIKAVCLFLNFNLIFIYFFYLSRKERCFIFKNVN